MRTILAIVIAAFPLAVGCQNSGGVDLRRENVRLTEQIADRDRTVQAKDLTIQQLNEQLRVARAIKPDDLQRIFYPDTIEFVRLTGGYNEDGKPGDDGIVVYLQPRDRDGDAIKVAGDIRIELFDLGDGGTIVGTCTVPADESSKAWYGKFNTYHYTIKCPWKGGPPRNAEITVRATFVDYLTQRVMTNQMACKVALPITR